MTKNLLAGRFAARPLARLVATLVAMIFAGHLAASEAKFAEFRAGVETLEIGKSHAAQAHIQIGSPYWKRVRAEVEEWRYPVSGRDLAALTFVHGVLTERRNIRLPMDSNFIHDDSPIMNKRGAQLRSELAQVKIGAPASTLLAIRKPNNKIPMDEFNGMMGLLRSEAGKMGFDADAFSDVSGDTWQYYCGDLVVSFVISEDRVVEITEMLNPSKKQMREMMKQMQGRNW